MCYGEQDGLPAVSSERLTLNTRSGLLTIRSVTRADAGKYLCIASNVVGRMTAERIVDVNSKNSSLSLSYRRHHDIVAFSTSGSTPHLDRILIMIIIIILFVHKTVP